MANSRNVVEIIDGQPVSWFQIRVVLLGILSLFWDGYDNQSMAFVAPALRHAWHIGGAELGPVFSAGVVGAGLGGLMIGPFGDRFGRTRILIGTMVFTGVVTLLAAHSTTVWELVLSRFLIGFSLGAAMPICIVLSNEYAPIGHRATMVTFTIIGYAIGAASGGFLAAHLVPLLGWASVFYLGGAATLLLSGLLYFWMPESIRFLALKPDKSAQIAAILRRINPALSFEPGTRFITLKGTEAPDESSSFDKFRELFSRHNRLVTILLWITLFVDYVDLNFLNNWLPSLLTDAGVAGPDALRAATALQFGGLLGTISMGLLADKFGYYRVVTTTFIIGGLSIVATGLVGSSVTWLVVTIFLAGTGVIGCNLIMGAVSATLYPTRIRSTGSGWAFGVARLISMVAPLLGGFVISLHWSLYDIFVIASAPMFLGALAVLALAHAAKSRPVVQVADSSLEGRVA